jgi:branched-subunit amino acid ABC-type transport system permease component
VQGIVSNPELSELVGTRTGITLLGVYAVAAVCSVAVATLLGMFHYHVGKRHECRSVCSNRSHRSWPRDIRRRLPACSCARLRAADLQFYIADTWALSGVFGIMLALLLLRPAGLISAATAAG